ncbi:MAG: hypothetical protein ACI9N9_000080 [Enterobacterales bacterium]|jgi:hypothetical protein
MSKHLQKHDEHGRLVFSKDTKSFWTVWEYDDPKPHENPASMTAKKVTHKHSHLYT